QTCALPISARTALARFAAIPDDLAVDPYRVDAYARLDRLRERRLVADCLRIEQYEIRKVAGFYAPALTQAILIRRQAGHAMYGLGKRQQILLTHHGSQYARERSPLTGMRMGIER